MRRGQSADTGTGEVRRLFCSVVELLEKNFVNLTISEQNSDRITFNLNIYLIPLHLQDTETGRQADGNVHIVDPVCLVQGGRFRVDRGR